MLDNETPFEWRRATGSWFIATLWWGAVWMIPFVLIASQPTSSGFLLLGSLGLPFISGYLLFRTIAKMVTRPWANDDELKVPTMETTETEPAD